METSGEVVKFPERVLKQHDTPTGKLRLIRYLIKRVYDSPRRQGYMLAMIDHRVEFVNLVGEVLSKKCGLEEEQAVGLFNSLKKEKAVS